MADPTFLCSTVTSSLSSLIPRTSGIDKTVEQLIREGRELKVTWDEVERSVAAAERQQWEPRSDVKRWLERADGVLKNLDEFEGSYWDWKDRLHGVFGYLLNCGCPLFCGYALGARAADILVQVQELRGEKIDLDEVARPPRFLAVEKIPASTLPTIGYRQTLDEIWRYLYDDKVRMIGLCGLGVTGKYTLLSTINNDVDDLKGTEGSYAFEVVVWVNMSRDVTVEKLRKRIAKRCCLLSHTDGDDTQLPQLLFNFLSSKRFLLLLNDLWRSFDLAEVGIPVPDSDNKSKIVFTTRSDYVCAEMEADRRIVLELLDERDSWELFRTRVPGHILDTPSVREHADALVAACGGLVIALIRVGRTMANKRRPDEWEWARKAIYESPAEFRGMDEVISMLKESFDCLSSDLARTSLLHFSSAFRDRDVIDVEELVDSLIKGGLLSDEDRARGYGAIEDLRALFLLQARGDGHTQVKIHPMVRIMALQIAKELDVSVNV